MAQSAQESVLKSKWGISLLINRLEPISIFPVSDP